MFLLIMCAINVHICESMLYDNLICGCCRAKQEVKAGKKKSRHQLKRPHLSFTHSLNKRRRLDSVERRKLKRKQNKNLRHKSHSMWPSCVWNWMN